MISTFVRARVNGIIYKNNSTNPIISNSAKSNKKNILTRKIVIQPIQTPTPAPTTNTKESNVDKATKETAEKAPLSNECHGSFFDFIGSNPQDINSAKLNDLSKCIESLNHLLNFKLLASADNACFDSPNWWQHSKCFDHFLSIRGLYLKYYYQELTPEKVRNFSDQTLTSILSTVVHNESGFGSETYHSDVKPLLAELLNRYPDSNDLNRLVAGYAYTFEKDSSEFEYAFRNLERTNPNDDLIWNINYYSKDEATKEKYIESWRETNPESEMPILLATHRLEKMYGKAKALEYLNATFNQASGPLKESLRFEIDKYKNEPPLKGENFQIKFPSELSKVILSEN